MLCIKLDQIQIVQGPRISTIPISNATNLEQVVQ